MMKSGPPGNWPDSSQEVVKSISVDDDTNLQRLSTEREFSDYDDASIETNPPTKGKDIDQKKATALILPREILEQYVFVPPSQCFVRYLDGY